MSPEKQRIAIAEACGWERRVSIDENDKTIHWILYDSKGNCVASGIPDYLNDLNAMHEAEEYLPPNLLYNYQLTLVEIMALHMKEVSPRAKQFLFHATAAQRAEAFLKTIGKWEE